MGRCLRSLGSLFPLEVSICVQFSSSHPNFKFLENCTEKNFAIFKMTSEFEERFADLTQNKNIVGAMILTGEGKTVRTTFDNASSSNYAEFAYKLIKTTRELLQETDSGNDVKFFRLTTKKHEIMMSPDNQYVLLVIHQSQDER